MTWQMAGTVMGVFGNKSKTYLVKFDDDSHRWVLERELVTGEKSD